MKGLVELQALRGLKPVYGLMKQSYGNTVCAGVHNQILASANEEGHNNYILDAT